MRSRHGRHKNLGEVLAIADGRDSRSQMQEDAALHHSRQVMAALFGAPEDRHFDVRYWDGTRDIGGAGTSSYVVVLNHPGALRRMLLPPSELALVEAYLAGDADVEGDLDAAVTLGDAINARLKSPRTLRG